MKLWAKISRVPLPTLHAVMAALRRAVSLGRASREESHRKQGHCAFQTYSVKSWVAPCAIGRINHSFRYHKCGPFLESQVLTDWRLFQISELQKFKNS